MAGIFSQKRGRKKEKKMATFLNVLMMVPVLLTLVERWVQIAETENVSGEEKRRIVVEAVVESLSLVEVLPGIGGKIPLGLITPLIGPMVDMTVRVYNLTKKFGKKEKKDESKTLGDGGVVGKPNVDLSRPIV